ncbi:MAG: transposase [Planctomycetaceae bacterium]|nr:transposase [Planctomycetaceae bacterium]
MPRPSRADAADGIYHALNRGNSRAKIFRKDADYEAFEQILEQGLEQYDVQLFCYQLMPDHWHIVLRPNRDGEMSRFMRWITATHTMRSHAHYQTLGEGHVYQGRFKSFPVQEDGHFLTVCRYVERNALRAARVPRAEDWRWGSLWRWLRGDKPAGSLLSPWPISRLPHWVEKVNQPLAKRELAAVRRSAQRGCPFGDSAWMELMVKQFGLECTVRARGRPKVRFLEPPISKSPDFSPPLAGRANEHRPTAPPIH